MIELAAAMVRDVNPLDAVIERDGGILGSSDALDCQRNLETRFDALHRVPIERGLEGTALHPPPSGGHEAFGDIALAPAVMGGIDGETERCITVRNGALDVIVNPSLVAAHVQLINAQRIGRRHRQLLESGIADGAEHMRGPEFVDRAHHRFGACRMKAF